MLPSHNPGLAVLYVVSYLIWFLGLKLCAAITQPGACCPHCGVLFNLVLGSKFLCCHHNTWGLLSLGSWVKSFVLPSHHLGPAFTRFLGLKFCAAITPPPPSADLSVISVSFRLVLGSKVLCCHHTTWGLLSPLWCLISLGSWV